ncbi:toxin-antitoxin system YwqK family antitoxin [Mangrovimonas sp. TPBH4]|uniref:toxin-antitoxin system YwqK family antitoxin n=1 Tax=Mangrovimonas sp. TPBH4 TaxID=1645914 RepID=UPI0006B50A87|nr:preprotein translocase YidC [Mangrovimonas sp. TPBH4]
MKLKYIQIMLCFLATSVMLAQQINQFDSKGLRHGIWRKNFHETKQPRYEGEFNHGKEIGVFKYYTLNNKKSVLSATKTFNPNNDIAEVKFFSSTGKLISEGKMNGKLYMGKWVYYHNKTNAIMSTETYNNQGNLDGEKLVYYDNGQIAERVNYVNGKIQGVSRWYSETGVVLKEFHYVNDELHGEAKYYNDEGQLLVEGNYKRDRKDGIWKYYKDGKLEEEKDFTKKSKNPYKQ